MITLKNIQKTDGYISADYYPEDIKEPGHIVVDLETGEFVQKEIPKSFPSYALHSHLMHARRVLLSLSEKEVIPTEGVEFWY